MPALAAYCATKRVQDGYAMDATRWLNEEYWRNDDFVPASQSSNGHAPPQEHPPEGYSWDKDTEGRWIHLNGDLSGLLPYGCDNPDDAARIDAEKWNEYRHQKTRGRPQLAVVR